MALKTFVKINHVTNLTDARYCSGMMVDLLGFSLTEEDSNYIAPDRFKEITGWVSGVEFVGEFTGKNKNEILEVLKDYPNINWIESDRLETLEALADQGYSLIYKTRLKEIIHLEPQVSDLVSKLGIILSILPETENLTESEKESISSLCPKCKVILGGGIDAENVLNLVNELKLYGVSLEGGQEIKTGLRDFDLMAEVLEKLEIED
jgi:phosphoribosylanthranilate isomerase